MFIDNTVNLISRQLLNEAIFSFVFSPSFALKPISNGLSRTTSLEIRKTRRKLCQLLFALFHIPIEKTNRTVKAKMGALATKKYQ